MTSDGHDGPDGGTTAHDRSARQRVVIAAGIAAAIIILAVPAIALTSGRSAVPQPIQFNHAKHTGELGLDCSFCHQYARTRAHSGLPDETTCAICHAAPQGTSAEAARVTELVTAGESIQFNKLFRLADHVFYTHRRHVGVAELECAECHGDIASTTVPPERPLVNVTMDFCMDCHRERGASLECNACHR